MAGQVPQPPGLRDGERKGGDPVRNARLRTTTTSSRPASSNSENSPRSSNDEEKGSMAALQTLLGNAVHGLSTNEVVFFPRSRDEKREDEGTRAPERSSAEKGSALETGKLMEELVRAYNELEQERCRRKRSEQHARKSLTGCIGTISSLIHHRRTSMQQTTSSAQRAEMSLARRKTWSGSRRLLEGQVSRLRSTLGCAVSATGHELLPWPPRGLSQTSGSTRRSCPTARMT
ncbi:hypothetical protein GUITHDRAFT_166425 [Guillardia theta CCMP2712]|uniref:Uncharacterized protein n=1 Tax=Guillardia theta (strain CCMP2712) TaxID=905079 RepID=L1IBT5_GUITC|nr:hypothetical protein GUITHDRAFT_166425 [Guillardia theta CCMP2712]EKX33557.1 hypothetical protein GUITHDRAFT_166425 [Guillardia theta CCMP2712]|eukprot:XP_005820537.1 hypothetical protein GUITHDRAFT_166425 [Guillardia theta CCMP2712]